MSIITLTNGFVIRLRFFLKFIKILAAFPKHQMIARIKGMVFVIPARG